MDMLKTCKKCNETKDISNFRKWRNSCKACGLEKNREWARKNKDKVNAANRKNYYKNIDKRKIKRRLYYINNREEIIAKETSKNKFRKEYRREYRKNNPLSEEKRRAHFTLYNHIKYGKIIRLNICNDCSSEGKTEGHHENYNKPLDVIWLCHRCHMKRHRKILINML